MAYQQGVDEAYCHETMGKDCRLSSSGDICIRSMTELRTKAGLLIEDVYFEGGDVLRCYEGRFRFALEGRPDIKICAGESIVIYPDQRVTIEALETQNLLLYSILDGTGVASYFDQFGFFDGLHGKTSTQRVIFDEVKRRLEARDTNATSGLMALFSDALTTYAHDFREGGNVLLFNSIRQIRTNLKNRIVRLEPLCEQLKISHTYLHRMFVRAGIGSPSDFVRREQLRIVMRRLRENEIPITEIAVEAGFISITHFANFVKRYTGMTARAIRRGCE